MTFDGIPDEGLAFLEDLEERNEREFFQANRAVYRERLLAPFTALLDAAAERLGQLAPDHGPARVFRIHRDLRFSKDKTPYHTTMRGYVAQRAPLPGVVETGYFVEFGPDGLFVAGGMWHPARSELERLRAGIADDDRGARLVEVLRRAVGVDLEPSLDALRRMPRSYPPDHPGPSCCAPARSPCSGAPPPWPLAGDHRTARPRGSGLARTGAAQPLARRHLQRSLGVVI